MSRARPHSERLVRLLAGLTLGLAGCAALPWPQVAIPIGPRPGPAGLLDLRGVVHVHTRGSHDSPGTIASLTRGARSAGVLWVALTEHTRPGGPPQSGVRDGVLLVPGFEFKAWGGSLLALGVDQRPGRRLGAHALVRAIHAAGGLAFAGHFETSRLDAVEYLASGLDGVSIANLHASALQVSGRMIAGLLFLPGPFGLRTLMRIPQGNFEHWETLPRADAIVAGVDAHAKFRLLGPLGGTIDGYDRMFRLLTTHVLARAPTRSAILDALRAGRSYIAFEGLGTVDRFRFERRGGDFLLEAPRRSTLVLVCDGIEAARSDAPRSLLQIPEHARRCRGEARLGRRLWIATSYQRVESDQDLEQLLRQ